MANPKKRQPREGWDGNTKQRFLNFGLYPGDVELMDALCEYLGCSQAEVFRTALRMMAANLRINKEGPE